MPINTIIDKEILGSLARGGSKATYVIRNSLDWPDKPLHNTGLTTSKVLRACRRLERLGYIEQEHRTSYLVMKVWKITPRGESVLEAL